MVGDLIMKLNNKGFSLVEVLAVVVIMGVLATIMVPIVADVINKNKSDNYENSIKSIISAAKLYISDNRYELSLGDECVEGYREVSKNDEIVNGKIIVETLVDGEYLSSNIKKLTNNNKKINIKKSYIVVKFNCSSKKFVFAPNLIWE